jgi:hypothetical protein
MKLARRRPVAELMDPGEAPALHRSADDKSGVCSSSGNAVRRIHDLAIAYR